MTLSPKYNHSNDYHHHHHRHPDRYHHYQPGSGEELDREKEAVAPLSTNLLFTNYSRSPPSRPLNARCIPPRKARSGVLSILLPRAWSKPPPPPSPPHPSIPLDAPELPPLSRHSFLDPSTFDRDEYWLDLDTDSESEVEVLVGSDPIHNNRHYYEQQQQDPSHKRKFTAASHIAPASPAQTISPSTTAAYLFCVPSPAVGAFGTPAVLRSKKATERVGRTRGRPLNASYKPPTTAGVAHKRRRFQHARTPTATFPQIPSFADSRSPTYPPRIPFNPELSLAQAARQQQQQQKPKSIHRSPRTPPRRRYRRARGTPASPTKASSASRSRTSLRHSSRSRSRLHRPSAADLLTVGTRSIFRRRAARILHDHRPAPKPPINPTVLAAMRAIVDQTAFPVMRNGITGSALPNGSPRPRVVVNEEDARIAWSMQFWVTIADPVTQHVFFACPATGQCSWEPPVGAFVVPRSPEGEWWELADASRDNQCYYYNTLTGATQWNRPGSEAFVIPLGLIQQNAIISARPDRPALTPSPLAREEDNREDDHDRIISPVHTPPPPQSLTSSVASACRPPSDSPISYTGTLPDTTEHPVMLEQSATASSSGPRTPVPDVSSDGEGLTADAADAADVLRNESEPTRASWWDRRKTRGRLVSGSSARSRRATVETTMSGGEKAISPPGSPSMDQPTALPQVGPSGNVNIVIQPSSPTSAAYDLNNFTTDNFADRYFATKRSGMLRQRLSLERIMEWQRSPIAAPLLVLSKACVTDALSTFKVIQHVMGERDRPVDAARPNASNHGAMSSVLSLRSTRDDWAGKDDKTIILEEIRWMVQLGVGRSEMRDELYCQLIKQLTRNPDHDATVLGFQLFCVFVQAFGPSKSFEPFVRSFLVGNVERTEYGIGVMSKYCLSRLDAWVAKGGGGRVLSIIEIEHASDAAFYPSVYGQSLETIMQRQEGAYPELRIPIILPFLADGILALGGTASEGIFRVPGDNDVISQLRTLIDRGQYQLDGVEDPHVVASLFKLWLRDLEEPLVPSTLYDAALESSRSVDHSVLFLKRLPDHNRRVLLFVISFMQLFLEPSVVAVTKMTPQNISLVLAPNILRTPNESLATVFANSASESQFVLNLLLHLDPPSVDPEYVPTHGQ